MKRCYVTEQGKMKQLRYTTVVANRRNSVELQEDQRALHDRAPVAEVYAIVHVNLKRLANSMPSASVPTLASMAYPSCSNRLHSNQRSFKGTEKVSMNSFSSNSGCGF